MLWFGQGKTCWVRVVVWRIVSLVAWLIRMMLLGPHLLFSIQIKLNKVLYCYTYANSSFVRRLICFIMKPVWSPTLWDLVSSVSLHYIVQTDIRHLEGVRIEPWVFLLATFTYYNHYTIFAHRFEWSAEVVHILTQKPVWESKGMFTLIKVRSSSV
jgi:hypothetical protein